MESPTENKSAKQASASTKADAVAYRYTGDGHTFVMGVPARDITAAEFAQLTPAQQELLETHSADGGLYAKKGNS